MAAKKATDDDVKQDSGVDPVGMNYWDTDLAKQQYEFSQAHTRAQLALEAVKLNVISNEDAAKVTLAFLFGEGKSDRGA